MTTTTAAASNGSTTTPDADGGIVRHRERATGMARVREAELYEAASVMNEAVSEAERLCGVIYRAISDAYFKNVRRNADNDGRTTAEVADHPETRDKAEEALNCLHAAEQHVRRLMNGSEPPF